MAGSISRTLNVFLFFVLFSGCCRRTSSSKISRLERRVNILEDRVDYNSDVFANDIERLFSLVNRTDTECVQTSPTLTSSSKRVGDEQTVQRLTVSLRKAFQQEKTLLRSMDQQIQQNWTLVNRDLTSRLTGIQAVMDSKEHNASIIVDEIREEQLRLQHNYQSALDNIDNLGNMLSSTQDKQDQLKTKLDNVNDKQIKADIGELQEILANVQDKQKQLTHRLDILLSDTKIMNDNLKKMNESLQSSTDLDHLRDYLMKANGWRKYGSSYYLFYKDENLDFTAAQVYCRSLGAKLVEINTAAERTFIKARVQELIGEDTWTGGIKNWNTWKWESGNQMKFTDWAPGEPSRGSEMCIEIWKPGSFKWNNAPCHDRNHLVCEISF